MLLSGYSLTSLSLLWESIFNMPGRFDQADLRGCNLLVME